MRKLAMVLVLGAALLAPGAAMAQALPAGVARAPATLAEWRQQLDANQSLRAQVSALARRTGVSEAVARNLAIDVFGAQPGQPAETYLQLAEAGLARLPQTIAAAQALDPVNNPALADLKVRAIAAAQAGRLAEATQLLDQYAQTYDRIAQQASDRIASTRAANHAAAAYSAYTAADYLGAASRYAQAAEIAPQSDARARWQYRGYQAGALYERGQIFGERAPLREAVRLYRDVVLPLSPRSTHASDWAQTQSYLANAHSVLGELGDDQAMRDAAIAHRAALEVFTRQSAPARWASMQNDLGVTLKVLGGRGDDQALREAIAAFRAALEVRTRQSAPTQWAATQINLGSALQILGQRGDTQALRDAIASYDGALEVFTRQNAPAEWAAAQNNLGNAHYMLGMRGDSQALRDAIAAYRAALEVRTRQNAPARWAETQNNLGAALNALGERGDDQALRDAVTTYRAALEIRTRQNAPAGWAQTQYNLATALRSQAQRGDRARLPEALAAARSALSGSSRSTINIGPRRRSAWLPNLRPCNDGQRGIVRRDRLDRRACRRGILRAVGRVRPSSPQHRTRRWRDGGAMARGAS